MKKVLALVLAAVLMLCASAMAEVSVSTTASELELTGDPSSVKVGVILVGDENEGYTYAHIEGIQQAAEVLGVPAENIIWKYSVAEDATCYDAAADLADAGCNVVFTNSYGHQTYCQQAAAEFPEVQFVSMTGDTANRAGLDNFSNAFTKVYESRYVSGVVAGMKIAELLANDALSAENFDENGNVKVGYVGAYPYAEVVSGYTAFFLGLRSIVPNVAMEVNYTNSWFDIDKEAAAAEALIAKGCVIIGQHADSTGAPAATQKLLDAGNVCYSVGYNVDMLPTAPTAALTSPTNEWSVFYTELFTKMQNGEEIAADWAEGFDTDAVAITELGSSCAAGTAEKVAEVIAAIKDGSLKVFDASTFTVDGATLTSAPVDMTIMDWATMTVAYEGETYEAIVDGAFEESTFRSAPYFALRIDGITEIK